MAAQLDIEYLNGMIEMFGRFRYASEVYLALAEEDVTTEDVEQLARQTIVLADQQIRLFEEQRGTGINERGKQPATAP